jgi:serine phosphatase RsbU (regulator of sigma subunit)
MMATATRRLSQTAARQGQAFMSHVRRVQTQLTPALPELDDFEVAAQLVAGHGRCGDVCDMVRIDDGGACALVVDSGGHGILGLAQAAAIRTALRTALSVPEAAADLGEVFNALNGALIGVPGRQLVACCAVTLNLTAGRLSYVNAGTAMPLLLPAATRLQTLEHPSLILGTDAEYSYDTTTVDLPPDFRLVLYTDGLVDSCNAGGEPFGEERLKTVLLDPTSFGTPNEMVATVVRAFNEHLAGNPHDDDALIMVIGR